MNVLKPQQHFAFLVPSNDQSFPQIQELVLLFWHWQYNSEILPVVSYIKPQDTFSLYPLKYLFQARLKEYVVLPNTERGEGGMTKHTKPNKLKNILLHWRMECNFFSK